MACSTPVSPYAWKYWLRLLPEPEPPPRPLLLPHAASVPAAAMPAAARKRDRRDQLLLLNADMLTSLSRVRLRLSANGSKGVAVRDVNLRLRLRQGVGRSLFEALRDVRDAGRHGVRT